jgi:hypothetical protein
LLKVSDEMVDSCTMEMTRNSARAVLGKTKPAVIKQAKSLSQEDGETKLCALRGQIDHGEIASDALDDLRRQETQMI